MSAVLREPAEQLAPMRPADLPDVLAVEQAAYEFPWTHGNFIDSLRAGHSAWTMRDSSGNLIAYAVVMMAIDEAHLLNLTVAPECQRFGFGWRRRRAPRPWGARSSCWASSSPRCSSPT